MCNNNQTTIIRPVVNLSNTVEPADSTPPSFLEVQQALLESFKSQKSSLALLSSLDEQKKLVSNFLAETKAKQPSEIALKQLDVYTNSCIEKETDISKLEKKITSLKAINDNGEFSEKIEFFETSLKEKKESLASFKESESKSLPEEVRNVDLLSWEYTVTEAATLLEDCLKTQVIVRNELDNTLFSLVANTEKVYGLEKSLKSTNDGIDEFKGRVNAALFDLKFKFLLTAGVTGFATLLALILAIIAL